MSCPPCAPAYAWLDENTISRPSLRTLGWMSLPVLLSSLTAVAGPNRSPSGFSLTKRSPGTLAELLEKKSCAPSPIST